MAATFSVVIVNWNGLKYLPRCLDCLQYQERQADEIIVVDNGSIDQSVTFLKDNHPDVRLIELKENIGFAAANNLAAREANSEWLVLLNPDAFAEPGWLAAYEQALCSAQLRSWVGGKRFDLRLLDGLAQATTAQDPVYDLWVTTSAIQRLDGEGTRAYLAQVRAHAHRALIMAPNGDNRAHLTRTRLRGLALQELVSTCRDAALQVLAYGYVDLPPFPPGITRSSEAKERAAESKVERVAMGVLEAWSVGERYLPRVLRRRFAHLVWAYLG